MHCEHLRNPMQEACIQIHGIRFSVERFATQAFVHRGLHTFLRQPCRTIALSSFRHDRIDCVTNPVGPIVDSFATVVVRIAARLPFRLWVQMVGLPSTCKLMVTPA